MVVPLSSGGHPSLSPGLLGRRAEQMGSRRPLPRQYHCCQLFPKHSCSSLTLLFLPFLLSSCFTLFFSLFPVISQFLKFDTMMMLAKRSPITVFFSMYNLHEEPARHNTHCSIKVCPRRCTLAYYIGYVEKRWPPKVCGNEEGLENPTRGCLCAEFFHPPAGVDPAARTT